MREAAEADGGQSAREFQGEGNRQYLTGLKLGGNRIAIMIDASASMLAPEVVNVIRLRNQSSDRQRAARKWVQALDTVDWLTAQLPTGSRYQIIVFNTEARFALPETQGRWLEVANSDQVERVITQSARPCRQAAPRFTTPLNFSMSSIASPITFSLSPMVYPLREEIRREKYGFGSSPPETLPRCYR